MEHPRINVVSLACWVVKRTKTPDKYFDPASVPEGKKTFPKEASPILNKAILTELHFLHEVILTILAADLVLDDVE